MLQLYIGPREVATIEDALRRFAAPETLESYKARPGIKLLKSAHMRPVASDRLQRSSQAVRASCQAICQDDERCLELSLQQ